MSEAEKVHVFNQQEQDPTRYQHNQSSRLVTPGGVRLKNEQEWEEYWRLCDLLEIEEQDYYYEHGEDE